MTADVVAPPGSQISESTVNGMTIGSVTPPQALQASSASGASSTTGATTAAQANPPNHAYYNYLFYQACGTNACASANSDQYSIQELPGNWLMSEMGTGTEWPKGSTQPQVAVEWNAFPGEVGDSTHLNYSPNGDSVTGANPRTESISFSYDGFSYGTSWTEQSWSGIGPYEPNGASYPAFGSEWWSTGGNFLKNGLGHANYVHLGPGQTPYDSLYVGGS